jgi:uncharacterized spore protein YtfJ
MDKLQAGTPLVTGKLTLLPIESITTRMSKDNTGYWIAAQKKPRAMIICDTNSIRALDLESKEVPLEDLIRSIPGLHTTLSSLR